MIKEILIERSEGVRLAGHLSLPEGKGISSWVIFAHGSGSSRKSTRNNWVASRLNEYGIATLLFDLLTVEEDAHYRNRFDIPLLAERLLAATQWLLNSEHYQSGVPVGYFGASTGAAAALVAAAQAPRSWPLRAIVSRGGRPDLAGEANLSRVSLPTLLIVGSRDTEVISLNEMAGKILSHSKLTLVEGATHLFEEPGTLDQVVRLSADWFNRCLLRDSSSLQANI